MFTRGPKLGLRFTILIILSIVLMMVDHRLHYFSVVRNALTVVVAPIQYMVSAPIRLAADYSVNFSSRQQLIAENTALRAQHLLLQAQLQKFTALENENKQLRDLLASSTGTKGITIVAAQLLAVETDPLVSEVVLDKGKKSGIYIGQPVLDARGIMGQIVQVGSLTSRVLLITDLRSAVPIQDARTGVRGLVVGQGKLVNLLLTNIPNGADIRMGDELVTSGLDGRYPAGYPVGVVKSVQHEQNEQFTRAEVVPSALLNQSQQVLLIWPPKAPIIDAPKLQTNKTPEKTKPQSSKEQVTKP